MQRKESKNLTKEDIEILKFLSKYKMLKVEDGSLIYKTKRYYRQRINNLIAKEYVKRNKSYIILGKKGRKILEITGTAYIKNKDNASYMERLKYIASIATITIDSNIQFIPSWEIKNKNIFTDTARRYIGKMIVEDKEYLVYFISNKKVDVYIKQLLFDINKAVNYENIIIFVDGLDVINIKYSNLVFGKENTYIILNTNENKQIIKRYNEVNYHEIIENIYQKEILISNWEKADYLLENNRYIVNMTFINTEKIEKINWYYKENANTKKKIDIVTLEENKQKIQEMLIDNRCNIITFDKNLLGGKCETQNI